MQTDRVESQAAGYKKEKETNHENRIDKQDVAYVEPLLVIGRKFALCQVSLEDFKQMTGMSVFLNDI